MLVPKPVCIVVVVVGDIKPLPPVKLMADGVIVEPITGDCNG